MISKIGGVGSSSNGNGYQPVDSDSNCDLEDSVAIDLGGGTLEIEAVEQRPRPGSLGSFVAGIRNVASFVAEGAVRAVTQPQVLLPGRLRPVVAMGATIAGVFGAAWLLRGSFSGQSAGALQLTPAGAGDLASFAPAGTPVPIPTPTAGPDGRIGNPYDGLTQEQVEAVTQQMEDGPTYPYTEADAVDWGQEAATTAGPSKAAPKAGPVTNGVRGVGFGIRERQELGRIQKLINAESGCTTSKPPGYRQTAMREIERQVSRVSTRSPGFQEAVRQMTDTAVTRLDAEESAGRACGSQGAGTSTSPGASSTSQPSSPSATASPQRDNTRRTGSTPQTEKPGGKRTHKSK